MKTKVWNKAKLWVFAIMLAAMTLCLSLGFATMGQRSAHAANPHIWMDNGGSFRYETKEDGTFNPEGKLGLGFITYVDYEYYNTLSATNDVRTGTLFVRKNDADNAEIDLTDADAFTHANLERKVSFGDAINSGWRNAASVATDTYYEFRGSVVNMKQLNVEKDYCARGYIAYKTKGSSADWTYEYATYDAEWHCRSIETIAQKALENSDSHSEDALKAIKTFAPRENSKQILTGNSLEYVYYADSGDATQYEQYTSSTYTPAAVKSNEELQALDTALNFNGYTGSAVEISAFSRSNRTYVKLPSRYAEANKQYSKIGVWFAISQVEGATWTNDITITANDSYVANGTNIVMGTTHQFNTFYYVEMNLPTVGDEYWANGYLRLWHLSTAKGEGIEDSVFKSEHKLYLGEVTYMTAQEIADRDNDRLAAIKNGLTSENWTQLTMQDRANATYATFNSEKSLEGKGGYEGASVSYPVKSQKYYDLTFPAGVKYLTADEDTTDKYLTVWIAVQSGATMQGSMSFYTNTVDYVFTKDAIAYVKNNVSLAAGTNPEWNATDSKGFEANRWYQLYIPLQNVVDANTAGTVRLFRFYADSTAESNNKLLIGNISVVTQADMAGHKNQVKAEILGNLTEGNYTQYKRGGDLANITFKSAAQWASEYTVSGEYTGNAVASTAPNNGNTYTVDISKDSLPTSGTLYLWVAVVVTNSEYTPKDTDRLRAWSGTDGTFGANFSNGVTNASDLAFNTWHKITRGADKVVMNDNGCLMLSLGIGDTWSSENYTILIGDFGIVA